MTFDPDISPDDRRGEVIRDIVRRPTGVLLT